MPHDPSCPDCQLARGGAGAAGVLPGYYRDALGLSEIVKPPLLAHRGGCWFRGNGIELHLGVVRDFRPAGKARPGLLWPDLDELAARLTAAGYPVRWADPHEVTGMRRFHTDDPHGNRLEFLHHIEVV